ncbi:hypothetical protein PACTADRAFT_4600 [Pachysolen tannophilus NRRL Y-2460]|uniref:FAD dependent oxidoreductase domain-containing protein n=1 Tax=Pachysolen tannophilus NRRL Y-2460 TaxID=669874 RepID=A0A1E4TPU9_PACTA|nr:hypothetical protein PACTADRAFT_4600 [Pachysolen tannophilus NRRL Y-2460]
MTESILIVGCGVFGLSTAVHLAERGGYQVTAIDLLPVPSQFSAANDFNKIIRCEYTDFIYTKMAVEAMKLWRSDPIFKGIYSECGRILITPELHVGRKEFEEESIKNLQKIPGEGRKLEYFKGGNDLANRFDFLNLNSVSETTEIKWNPEAGLAHAANSLIALYNKAVDLGVKFIFGKSGEAIRTVSKKNGRDYIITKDGTEYTADKIIISAGASTGFIVDLNHQQSATGLFVTHIKLTPQEYEKFKNIPILFDAEMGYFFPPDSKTHVLKIALPGSGASNLVTSPHDENEKISLPRYKLDCPTDTIPYMAIRQARALLKKFVPELEDHELFNSKACWIADTSDSHFIIDKVPNSKNLYVATGDSGHGFKFLPNIGKYIVDKLEGKLDPEMEYSWQWKQDRPEFDPNMCSWRVGSGNLDFSEIEWAREDDKGCIIKL